MVRPRGFIGLFGLAGILVCSIGLAAIVAQAPAPPSDTWPPPGVFVAGRDGVTIPRPVASAKTAYTAAARRAHIEGTVTLSCVVEADGTVGTVRIVRSLDSLYGLDDAAVTAAKAWRFAAATRDHVPVPTVVTMTLQFVLRPGTVAPDTALGLPEAFAEGAQDIAAPDKHWADVTEDASNVRVHLSHPSDWVIEKTPGSATELLRLASATGLLLVVERPRPSRVEIREPLSASAIQKLIDVSRPPTEKDGSRMMAIGQVRVVQDKTERLWIWQDVWVPSATLASRFPPSLTTIMRQAFDGARTWTFTSTIGKQNVGFQCAVVYSSTEPSGVEKLRQAGAQFTQILDRMKIEAH